MGSAIVSTSHTFFRNTSVASTNYLYLSTSVASTTEAARAGELKVSGYNLKTFQIEVPSMEASCTKVLYQLEGRIEPLATFAKISTASVTTLPSMGSLTTITDNLDYIRVGVKKTGAGAAAISVVGYFGEN